jgi:hypothetical protein
MWLPFQNDGVGEVFAVVDYPHTDPGAWSAVGDFGDAFVQSDSPVYERRDRVTEPGWAEHAEQLACGILEIPYAAHG